jgi:photosystem II stability/assembly factor-like uncharacterized protein
MTYTKSIATALVIILLISCKKPKTPDPGPEIKPVLDTLLAWQKVNLPEEINLSDIYFQNSQNGFFTFNNGINKSTDSGKTWQVAFLKTGGYSNFFPLSANTFFVNDQQSIGYSYTAGTTWANRQIASIQPKDIFFTSDAVGYVTSNLGLQRTVDTGRTWQPVINASSNGVWFFSNGKGVCFAGTNIYITNDGINWAQGQNLSLPNIQNGFYTMFFSDLNNGWLVAGDKIAKTTDGGITWTTQNRSHIIWDIHFVNNLVGYYCSTDEIYKSTDGGNTWSRVCKVAKQGLIEIYFTDENTGWACGQFGTLLRLKN